MNIAVILSGGVGRRMGAVKLPKQFLEVCATPIIILTLKKVFDSELFDRVLIVSHSDWIDYLKELLVNHGFDLSKLMIVPGGKERLDSIENALDELKQNGVGDDDVVVIHDAVRPFVSKELLNRAVDETKKWGATVAVVPVKDTMIVSECGVAVDMPDRTMLYHGQSPDSFKFGLIYNAIKTLSDEERRTITGTAQICQTKGEKIHTYPGDERNIKITTLLDLFLATAILREGGV